MAYKVPVQALMASLQKAGVPMQGSDAMQGATPGLGQTISSQVQSADTVGPQIKANFLKQLDQVAQMDQKLGAVYSDPTSPLHTNNVYAREKIISGAHSTNSSAVKNLAGKYQDHQKSLDDQVSETVDLYKQLTALQAKEEARAEKLAKEQYRIGQGKAKYITDAKGNKVMVPVFKGKSGSSASNAISRAQELRDKKGEIAHLADDNAVNFFDNTTSKFQNYWIGKLQDGEMPPDGFSKDEVENEYNYWMKTFKPQTASQLNKGDALENLKKTILGQ